MQAGEGVSQMIAEHFLGETQEQTRQTSHARRRWIQPGNGDLCPLQEIHWPPPDAVHRTALQVCVPRDGVLREACIVAIAQAQVRSDEHQSRRSGGHD